MSSDDDSSFSFKPLGGSLHVRRAAAAAANAESRTAATSAAPARPAYQSGSDIANKYLRKAAAPAAAATPEPVAAVAPSAAQSPKFVMPRPSSSSVASPSAASTSTTARGLERSELDESVDPGASKASPEKVQPQQPGSSSRGARNVADDSSFFTESPFQTQQVQQQQQQRQQQPQQSQQTRAASPSSTPLRHSYVDPRQPGKMQRRPVGDDEEESPEESPFTKQVKPLMGSSLWEKHVDVRQSAAVRDSKPTEPVTRSQHDDERKGDVRMEEFAAASARQRSPSPRASSVTAGASPQGSAHDQSRVYAELLERWEQDQQEIKHLRAEKALREAKQREQQQQGQPQQSEQQQPTDQQANPLLYFSASPSQRPAHPPLPEALHSSHFELDRVGALQLVHSAQEKASLAASAKLVQEAYYSGDVKMDEVLADHRRLRQRLRAAQHAIEALAAGSEPGAVDTSLGQGLRGGSVSNALSPARARGRSGYAPAIQSPNALSLSQYAHLPPARAVLKLLNRLEREEEQFLADRATWKSERASLLHQIQTLYTDLKHLTALSHQAALSENYHRQREVEQEDAISRLKQDREAERKRWTEVEAALRDTNLRERVRFTQELSALERNDGHYKEKYDALLQVLKRYEKERNLPANARDAQHAVQQQQKLFDVMAREWETEREALSATLHKQEAKFQELQKQVALTEQTKDALLREARAEIEQQTARRVASEQQLLALQHNVTKSLDDKLQQLNSFVDTERQAAKGVEPTVQHAAAEIANQYARAQEEAPLYEPRRRRSASSDSRPSSRRYADDDSGRSLSPLRRGVDARPHRRSSRSLQAHVSSAQQLLSLLPPNSNVRGQINLVLPPSDEDSYDDESDDPHDSRRRRGRPRYSRDTCSSRHAAAMAQQLYCPVPAPAARSRSRSVSRPRERSRERMPEAAWREDQQLERDDAGSRVRREVDRRVQFENDEYVAVPPVVRRRARSLPRRSVSREREQRERASDAPTRVGPAVNGHSGVTIRVMKQQPPTMAGARVSAGTKAAATKSMVRQAYNAAYDNVAYDRYGRITEARYV